MRVERDFTFDDPAAQVAELLEDVARFYRRFLVFQTEHEPVASALWVLHCWTFEAADCTPYMIISSAEPESGKSRFLEVSEIIVPKPWYVDIPSEAVIYRFIDEASPTVLLDEYGGIFSDKRDSEGMQALLCAGFRRGRKVPRCIGQGANIQPKNFHVFAPKALAGIGRLPDPIDTRKIPINLLRKTREERVERFRLRDVEEQAANLRERVAAWAESDVIEQLKIARPELPEELTDRQQDIWEPLLAIADLAGGDWPKRAREAARELHTASKELSEKALLLEHIRQIFSAQDRISSEDLLRALVARDDGPWAVWWSRTIDDGNINGPAARLAANLKPFAITSKRLRIGEKNVQGYERAAFEDTWKRYLPDSGKEVGTVRTHGTPQVGVTRDVPTVPSVPTSIAEQNGSGDWTFGEPTTACTVCGDNCHTRDPDGRMRHTSCEVAS